MAEEGRRAPHGLLFAVVVGLMVAAPTLLDGDAMLESFSDILGPVGLLLLPILLILAIAFLSSDRAATVSEILGAAGEPNSIHRLGGSPVGVGLVLVLLLLLLYYRVTLFGSDNDSGD